MIELGNGGGEVTGRMEVPTFLEDLDYLALGFGEFALFGKQLVAGDGLGLSFYDHVREETGLNFILRHLVGFPADHDVSIEGFIGGLKAGGLIDCIPHHGVLKLFVGAHVTCGDFTRVDPHPRVDVTTVLGFQLLFERLEALLLFEG